METVATNPLGQKKWSDRSSEGEYDGANRENEGVGLDDYLNFLSTASEKTNLLS
jgi:hypothetical protein